LVQSDVTYNVEATPKSVTFKETLRVPDGGLRTVRLQVHQWVTLFDFMRNHFELARLHVCIDFTEDKLRFALTFGDELESTFGIMYNFYIGDVRNARDLLPGFQI
jgi:hypothetical protein